MFKVGDMYRLVNGPFMGELVKLYSIGTNNKGTVKRFNKKIIIVDLQDLISPDELITNYNEQVYEMDDDIPIDIDFHSRLTKEYKIIDF